MHAHVNMGCSLLVHTLAMLLAVLGYVSCVYQWIVTTYYVGYQLEHIDHEPI